MPFSYNTFTASVGQTLVPVPFPYAKPIDIHININGEELPNTDFVFNSASVIALDEALAGGELVRVYRRTNRDAAAVTFQSGTLTSRELNQQSLQLLYISQETLDEVTLSNELLSDAVSQGNVPIYSTFYGLPNLDIPLGISSIIIKGGITVGDIGDPLNMVRVDGDPGHPGARQSKDGSWWELKTSRVPVALFGTNFDVSLLKALETGAAIGAAAELAYNGHYLLTAGVVVSNIDVVLLGNGSRIERAADGATDFYGLDIQASFTNINLVVAIGPGDYDFGTTATNSKVTRIEMASSAIASQYAAKDIIRVVANNKIASSPAEDNERVGESAAIAAVVDKYIYLGKLLEMPYLTGVRIAKMTPCKVRATNLSIGDEDGSPTGRRKALIRTQAITDIRFSEVVFEDALTLGWERVACHEPKSRGCRAERLRTVPPVAGVDPGTWSYGIAGYAETGALDTDMFADGVRHITTGGALPTNEDDTRIERFGGRVNYTLNGAVIVQPEHAACDDHPDSKNTTQINVRTIGGHRGPLGSYFTHQMRGEGGRLIGAQSDGAGGLAIDMIGNDGNHYAEISHRRPAGFASTAPMMRIRGPEGGRGMVTIIADMRAEDGTSPLIELANCIISPASRFIIDWKFDDQGPTPFSARNVEFRGEIIFDTSRTPIELSTSPTLFDILDDNCDIAPAKVTLSANDDAVTFYLADFTHYDEDNLPEAPHYNGRAVFPHVEIGRGLLNGTNGGFINPGTEANYWVRDFASHGERQGRGIFSQAFTSAGLAAIVSSPRGHEHVVARLSASVSGVIIDTLPRGLFDGQLYTLINNGSTTNTQTITIKHNPTGLIALGGSSITKSLLWNAGATFVWQTTGGVWRPVQDYTPD